MAAILQTYVIKIESQVKPKKVLSFIASSTIKQGTPLVLMVTPGDFPVTRSGRLVVWWPTGNPNELGITVMQNDVFYSFAITCLDAFNLAAAKDGLVQLASSDLVTITISAPAGDFQP